MEFDASGGSYGRVAAHCNTAVGTANGASTFRPGTQRRWRRYQSPSADRPFYGDLVGKAPTRRSIWSRSVADNFFGVIGPTPVELLNNDYRSIFTWPQTTKNQAQLLALNGRYAVTDHWTVRAIFTCASFSRRTSRQRRRGRALQR